MKYQGFAYFVVFLYSLKSDIPRNMGVFCVWLFTKHVPFLKKFKIKHSLCPVGLISSEEFAQFADYCTRSYNSDGLFIHFKKLLFL